MCASKVPEAGVKKRGGTDDEQCAIQVELIILLEEPMSENAAVERQSCSEPTFVAPNHTFSEMGFPS